MTLTRLRRTPRCGALRLAASGQFLIRNVHAQDAVVHVNLNLVTGLHQADSATSSSLRGNVANRDARGTTRETAIGNQGALLAQAQALQVGGRVQHLLHTRATLRTLVLDDDDVALLDVLRQNLVHGLVLRLDHEGTALEVEQFLINTSGLNDCTVLGNVAVQDRQAAVLGVGVLDRTDATVLRVSLVGLVLVRGRERAGGAHATGGCQEEVLGLLAGLAAADVPLVQPLVQRIRVNRMNVLVEQAGAVQLTQQGGDTAGTVHMLNVVLGGVRGDLRQAGNLTRDAVDVVQGEVGARLVSNRQGVQHGVGRTTHRHIQGHGVLERLLGSNRAGQNRLVILVIVTLGQLNDAAAGIQEQLLTSHLGSQGGAVTGQCQADSLVQAVHGVCGEHTSAGTAGGAGVLLNLGQLLIADAVVNGHHHGVNQVEAVLHDALDAGTGLHRATGHKNRGDVQAHRGQKHTGGDLVTVRDADQSVGTVRVHHVLDRIRNQVARRQRVQHTVVTHSNTVINGNGVEFLGDATRLTDGTGDQFTHVLQVHVTGHKLGERVSDRNNGLAEIIVTHTGGTPQGASTGHITAVS